MAPVDYRTYTHPAIKNGDSYIDIKGSGNLKRIILILLDGNWLRQM